jgi:sigma-B regulation protein RsbU (phosphoserine phosphatase)
VAVLVSDVSGKDIPASLIMIMIRTVLNTLIKSGSSTSPDMIVKAVNQIMSSDFAIDKFATMLFLIINRKTGDLHFSNAGHAPVLIYRSDINKCSQLSVEGLPIGVDEDSEYVMGHTKLNTGDVTILYSDGVTEAWNPAKEEYQKGRVIRNLINFNALDAKTINEKIIADVWEFMQDAAQHDDTTLVVVKKT